MGLFKGYIAQRLLLSFGVLALLAVILIGVSFRVVQTLGQTLNQVQVRTDAAVLSSRIRADSLNLINLAQLYTQAAPDERTTIRGEISDQNVKLQDQVRQAKKLTSANDVQESIAIGNVENGVIAFSYRIGTLLNAIDTRTSTEGDLVSLVENYQNPLVRAIDQFQKIEQDKIQTARDQASQTIRTTLLSLGLIALIVLTGTALTVSLAARRVIAPLGRLYAGAEAMRQGNLSERIAVSGRDEIGALGDSLNNMAAQLQQRMSSEFQARQAVEKLNQELEERVTLRTQALEESHRELEASGASLVQTNAQLQATAAQNQRRARLLQASTEVTRAAALVRDPEALLPQAVQLISDSFGFYHAGVFLLDDGRGAPREWAVLRAACTQAADGEGGREMLARGHRLRVGDEHTAAQGLVGWVAQTGQPRIALDVGADAVHFDNPLLPHTRSEMALPLRVGDRILGVLDVQSEESAAFGEEDVNTLEALADQIAITIENAQLFKRTQAALDEAQDAYRRYVAQEWSRYAQTSRLETQEFTSNPALRVDGASLHEVTLAMEKGQVLALNRVPDAPSAPGGNGHGVDSPTGERNETPITLAQSALVAPIKLRDQVIGVLDLRQTDQLRTWTEDEVALTSAVANQVALAVENARLFEEANLRAEEMAALNELSRALVTSLNEDQVLEATYHGASRLLDTSNFYVALYDAEKDEVRTALESVEGRLERPDRRRAAQPGLTLHVLRHREPLLIKDNLDAWYIEHDVKRPDHTHAKSWLGVPLTAGDRTLGVIALRDYTTPRAYDEHARDVLAAIASQTSIALQNAYLFQQTQNRVQQLATLNEISRAASGVLNEERLFEVIYEQLQRVMRVDAFFVGLYSPGSDKLTYPLSYDQGQRYTESDKALTPGTSIHTAITTGEPVVVHRTPEQVEQAAQRMIHAMGDASKPSASLAYAPLKVGDRVLGVLSAQSYQYNAYSQENINLLTGIANQVAVALENARLFEQTQARVQQLAVLNEISRAASGVLESENLYETIYQQMQQIMDVGAFYIGLYDANSRVVTYPICYDEGRRYTQPDETLDPGWRSYDVIAAGEPRLIHWTPEEYAREAAQLTNSIGATKATASLAFVPLKLGERVTGLISVQSYRFDAYTQEHMNLLAGIANQVAVALENTRLFEEARSRALQLATASEAGRAATSILDMDELLATAVDLVRVRFGYYHASFFLLDGASEFASLQDTTSDVARKLKQQNYQLSVGGDSLIGWVTSVGRSRVTRSSSTDPAAAFPQDGLWPQVASELALPLKRGNQVIGALDIQSNDPRAFSADEVTVLELLADQLSIAVQNARLYGQTREQSVVLEKRAADLAVLNDVSRLVTQTLDEAEILNTASRVMVRHFGVGHCSVVLLNPATDMLRVAIEFPDQGALNQEMSLAQPALRQAIADKRAFAVDDVMSDPRTETMRPALRRTSIRSVMFLPLLIQNDVAGLIRLDAIGVVRRFSDDELSLGQTLASQVAVAMQNARLFDETRRRARETQRLYEIGQQLNSTLELQSVMQLVADASRELAGAGDAIVYIKQAGDLGYVRGISTARPRDAQLDEIFTTPRPGGLTDEIMRTGRAVNIPEVAQDVRASTMVHFGIRSQIGLPIQLGARSIGVVYAFSPQTNDFDQHDQELLTFLAGQAAIAIQNALLYEEQRQTAEKLREVDRVKTEFLASMSHELRTPLNSIIGFSRVILKGIDGPLTDLQKQDLEAIHGSGQHLLGLINNVLDITKIEAGKMELAFEEVDMQQTIKAVMATAVGLNKGKAIQLKSDVPEDLPTVWADSTRSRQVLLNLVSNASKFTESGSITCFATYDHKFVTLGVRDTGIGIPQDKLSMIFDEFTQVDSSTTRKYGGTGLGLAISRRFVEMHSGKIWVESEVGHGSTFYFTLPRAHAAEPPAEMPELVVPSGADDGVGYDGRRVLLAIDDDLGVITLYKRYLEKQGYRVIGVTDGRQAVDEALRLKPDVITVDILMPNKDGWSVIQELRQNEQTRTIPVVVCSIISEQGKGFSLGAADYLIKPIAEDDLVNALKRLTSPNAQTRVLIVDDTPDDLRLMRRILEAPVGAGGKPQYTISEAADGAAGVAAACGDNPPDLIILDLMMPELDGFGVIEALKSNARTREIPVVVVTAKVLTEQDHSRLNGYIEALLSKGMFSEQELMNQVAVALAKALTTGAQG